MAVRKLVVALLIAIALTGCTETESTSAPDGISSVSATAEPARSPTGIPTATAAAMETIGPGTYLVPDEISYGVYRVIGYWARLDSGFEIIDNDGVYDNGVGLMVVQQGDSYVELSGEAASIDEFPSVLPLALGYTEGTYIVGVDIQPGRYRVSDPDYAYAARLDRALGIIDNAGNSGSVIIQVLSSDFAFTYTGTIAAL